MARRRRRRQFWSGGYGDGGFPPYVPVGERRKDAAREIAARRKRGLVVKPVVIEGRKIAATFWGGAWCDHLEAYSDYASRLPRGRSYVRNGSVIDLRIEAGKVEALVQGSSLYTVSIAITNVETKRWKAIVTACAGRVGSVVELLRGKLSESVMAVVTDPTTGLFPSPSQINLSCSCPDWATMCKHVAATLYGVGARLDAEPELLFVLRGVDAAELVAHAVTGGIAAARPASGRALLPASSLSSVFGIELDAPAARDSGEGAAIRRAAKKTAKREVEAPPPEAPKKEAQERPKRVKRDPLMAGGETASAKIVADSVTKGASKRRKVAVIEPDEGPRWLGPFAGAAREMQSS